MNNPTTRYRLSFEVVNLVELWRYCNQVRADFAVQVVPNSAIPDEHWHPVSRETGDPWDQYRQLKAWADADEGFVRSVTLEQAVEPAWVRVDGPPVVTTAPAPVGTDFRTGRVG